MVIQPTGKSLEQKLNQNGKSHTEAADKLSVIMRKNKTDCPLDVNLITSRLFRPLLRYRTAKHPLGTRTEAVRLTSRLVNLHLSSNTRHLTLQWLVRGRLELPTPLPPSSSTPIPSLSSVMSYMEVSSVSTYHVLQAWRSSNIT